jgi:hypothetical protein
VAGAALIGPFGFANERLSNPQADWRQWPFDRDFQILLNVAVGGNWGGQKGVDESIWPQRMEIDYVRVLQSKSQLPVIGCQFPVLRFQFKQLVT